MLGTGRLRIARAIGQIFFFWGGGGGGGGEDELRKFSEEKKKKKMSGLEPMLIPLKGLFKPLLYDTAISSPSPN